MLSEVLAGGIAIYCLPRADPKAMCHSFIYNRLACLRCWWVHYRISPLHRTCMNDKEKKKTFEVKQVYENQNFASTSNCNGIRVPINYWGTEDAFMCSPIYCLSQFCFTWCRYTCPPNFHLNDMPFAKFNLFLILWQVMASENARIQTHIGNHVIVCLLSFRAFNEDIQETCVPGMPS